MYKSSNSSEQVPRGVKGDGVLKGDDHGDCEDGYGTLTWRGRFTEPSAEPAQSLAWSRCIGGQLSWRRNLCGCRIEAELTCRPIVLISAIDVRRLSRDVGMGVVTEAG